MDDNQRLSTLFSFVMIMATATLGWFTLKDSGVPRVGDSRLLVPVSADEQDVVARLWEDPLQAVQQAAAKAGTAPSTSATAAASQATPENAAPPKHTLESLRNSVAEVLAKNPSHRFALLVVPVPDTPYPDDFETRLRLRYSIQMALADRNYAPTSRSYLGYVHLKPTDPAAGPAQLGSVVPYEWFQPRQAQKAIAPKMDQVSILVLWLPEGRLARGPLQLLANLTAQLVDRQAARFNGVFMIGPQSSDTLKALIRDAKDRTTAITNQEFLKDRLAIFSGRATAPDGVLDLKSDPRWSFAREDLATALREKFTGTRDTWRYFHNCIATDDQLTDLIAVELTLRGLKPGHDEILVLAEADTAYGRSLPIALQASVDMVDDTRALRVTTPESFATRTAARIAEIMDPVNPPSGNEPRPAQQPLVIYRYLRGLDQQKGQNQASDKPAARTNAKTPEELLALALTRQGAMALGESQLDYVDRLVLDIENDASKRNAIRAVGVLGADIYDKMILLRSLRPRFPDAVFFTTDLDARLWHPDHLRFTRNLIVASTTDVRGVERDLNPAQIPPFRDSYQVAVFTACREALVLAARSDAEKPAGAPLPAIFEIGRDGPVPLVAFTSAEPQSQWPSLDSKSSVAFLWILVCLLCGSLLYVINYRIQPPVFSRFGFGVGLAFSAVVVFSLVTFYEFPAQRDAEPWSLHEGVSIWPTEILRLIIICTAVIAVFAARKYHREFRGRLAKRYFLGDFESTPTQMPSPRTFLARLRPLLGRAWSQFGLWRARQLAARRGDHSADEENNEAHVATVVFAEYVARARPLPRIARVLFATAVYLALGILLMIFLHGSMPLNTHIRGEFARGVDRFFLFASIICFLGFVFYVLDAVFITALLLDKIKRQTIWPPLLLQKKRQQFQVRNEDLDGFLDVSFAAEISAEIGKLIYLPFIIQFMFILSRNNFFDRWTWPPALIAVFVGNFALACVAWGVLRHSAKGIRGAALQGLKHTLRDAGQEAVTPEGKTRHKHLLRMRKLIEEEHRGAYSRVIQDPALLAMLLPSGVFGIAVIVGRLLFSDS